jgi:hypothetical protein
MPANPAPSPQPSRPPPPLPNDPSISNTLSNYLSQFSVWCRAGFADKIKSNVAQPGLLLQANDAPSGTIPAVFMLQVQTDGTLVAVPQALGGANPSAPPT